MLNCEGRRGMSEENCEHEHENDFNLQVFKNDDDNR